MPEQNETTARAGVNWASASESLGCVLVVLFLVAGVLGVLWLISDHTQKQEMIKAGYTQTVKDNHVIWVKPDAREAK